MDGHPRPIGTTLVGHSRRMRAVFDYVRVVANSDSTILIVGETGTGKEVLANLIHQQSSRRHHPFVPVSCALFSEELIESELFGHERGAFTDALSQRIGRFELAQKGTVFLDDVDDIPPALQVKLLRVLQTGTIERVGGSTSIPVDVRTIAASKRDLRQLVAEGRFRDDLYFRLAVIPIALPPLRERREDILALAEYFLKRDCARHGRDPQPLSPGVLQAFVRYSWPGNVRELENTCERIARTCTCGMVRYGCLPFPLLYTNRVAASDPFAGCEVAATAVSLDQRLREVEQNLIRAALNRTSGNKSRAAEYLHISRSTLGDRIRRLGLSDLSPDAVDESMFA